MESRPAGKAAGAGGTIASHRVFIAILLGGILLRLWNIGWGLPHLYEEAIPLRFGMKLWPSLPPSVDFHFFVYPAFGYYLQLFVQYLHFCAGYVAGSYDSLAAFIASFDSDPSAFTLVARMTTVAADAGIIILGYLILDRYHGRSSALIASAFMAFNVLHLRQSHLVNVDTLLAFFSVATLYGLYGLRETPSTKWYIISGAAIGFAAASKYNGAVLVIALVVVHFLSAKSFSGGLRPMALYRLVGGGAAAAAVFAIFNPLVFSHFAEFLEKFRSTESHMEAGHLGLDPGTSTAAYYLIESLPANLGIPITLAALGSFAWIAARREKSKYLLLLIPAIYAIMLVSWKMRADRYIFPAVPFLLMIAAVGVSQALPVLSRTLGGKKKNGFSPTTLTAGIVVGLLLIPSFLAVTSYQRAQGLPDTRTVAMEWIERNVKAGSAIAAGPFGIDPSKTKYISLPIQFTAVNSEQMTPFYNPEWYRDVDLVVVSDFDYGRYRLEPERFREILGYLDTLQSRWELVHSFEAGDSLSGPQISLYRYPGEDSDERFPSELVDHLLASDMDPERKVAFLGKLGLILSVGGKLTRSEQVLRALLTLDPNNETAHKALNDILAFRASTGSRGRAGVPEPVPPSGAGRAMIERGDSLLALERFDEAEKMFRAALGMDKTLVDAYMGLTLIYASRDDREKVIATLKDLLSILPPESEDYAKVQWQLKSIEEENH